MRTMRRVVMTIGVLMVALLPVTAAVTPEAATTGRDVPVAITQPVGHLTKVLGGGKRESVIPESAMIMLIGSGLLGLGTLVRRSTRA